MRTTNKRIGIGILAVLALACVTVGCGSPHGACLIGSGITQGCIDDTEADCLDILNGTGFSKGKTCAELGFTSA